ncbi:DUF645 family protein, partial [Vibrio cholerae]|nr:DUF645 family protein [Vibrio cholerae]
SQLLALDVCLFDAFA